MSELECQNCGTLFDSEENEEIVEEEIFVQDEDGIEKKAIEKQVYRNVPIVDPTTTNRHLFQYQNPSKEQVAEGWYRKY